MSHQKLFKCQSQNRRRMLTSGGGSDIDLVQGYHVPWSDQSCNEDLWKVLEKCSLKSLLWVGNTGRNGQHFSWGFFTLVPFNPNPINPSRIKAKSWMQTKTQLQGCNPVKWVERNSVNLWNLQIRWNCHCNWKLNNCKDDCFIQQSVIPMVKIFLLNCSPPSEVGLKPHLIRSRAI